MNHICGGCERFSDDQLLGEVQRLARCERQATAGLIAALAELDARRLYLGLGCSSMFTYCTQVLHLAEHAAYNRIEAARAPRRFPIILSLLTEGLIHLTAVRLLSPHFTEANHRDILREASHKSKRDIEQIVARLQPRPDVPAIVRRLPVTDAGAAGTASILNAETQLPATTQTPDVAPTAQKPRVEPLAPERYKVQFTVSRETYQKLRRAQDLLRHRIPSGDPAAIFDRALTVLLEELARTKLAATERPQVKPRANIRSRHVPAAVRRVVWARDEGRCRFEGPAGRCSETGLLEFHHIVPYAEGGVATTENLELRCAAHNRYEAEQYFGFLVRELREPYEAANTESAAPPAWCATQLPDPTPALHLASTPSCFQPAEKVRKLMGLGAAL